MSEYHINIKDSIIDNGSNVVNNVYENNSSNTLQNNAILQELKEIQKSIQNTEPIIANILMELEQAIREENKPKISTIINQLSTGFASAFLANIASGSLLSFLGIG